MCFKYCIHLIKATENKPTGDEDYPFRSITHFKCGLLNKELYSYKLEKYNSTYTNGLERMPLECEHYFLNPDAPFVQL